MAYIKQNHVDEVLVGSPTYNISGIGSGQTIALENVKTVTGTPLDATNRNYTEQGIENAPQKYTFVSAPTVNDDSDDGYGINDLVEVTGGDIYVARDVTVGAAVWENVSIGENGQYTPTGTGLANVASFTEFSCNYFRVGDIVAVSGFLNAAASVANTVTKILLTLPISAIFTALADCTGNVGNASDDMGGNVFANTASNEAELRWKPTVTTTASLTFMFFYKA